MIEVVPGIFSWSVFSAEKGLDFNGHWVLAGGTSVLIDPPVLAEAQAGEIDRGGRPAAILITNAHHGRDAGACAKRWGAPILVPEADAALLPAGLDPQGVFRDGDLLPAGLKAIALTGQKTPGESALLFGPGRSLIVGDAVIGRPPGSLSLLPDGKYADPKAARAGLRRLLEVPFESLLVGDGTSLIAGGRAALERLLA
jgi:glyoxylase-like metal-dependent hydrolase (beta-lactamase superfamily II)